MPKKNIFYTLTLALILSLNCYSINIASAKDIKHKNLKNIAGKTFWKNNTLNRIYFGPSGNFEQQINDDSTQHKIGTILKGKWRLKSSSNDLCLQYNQKQDTVSTLTIDDEFCLKASSYQNEDFLTKRHTDNFTLSINGSTVFNFNRWADGNYVFDPEYAPMISSALVQMSEMRANIRQLEKESSMTDLNNNMKKYHNHIVGKVFVVAASRLYFHPSGGYFHITEQEVEKSKKNINPFLSDEHFGRWFIKDDFLCFFRQSGQKSCEYVLPFGKGLTRPHSSFLGIHSSSFSRVYGEMGVNHININQTGNPKLFSKVKEKFEK